MYHRLSPSSYFKGAYTVITCHLWRWRRICYVRRHFSRGRSACQDAQRIVQQHRACHAKPRHDRSDSAMPISLPNQCQRDIKWSRLIASRRSPALHCRGLHPSQKQQHSVRCKQHWFGRPPRFSLSCQKCTSPVSRSCFPDCFRQFRDRRAKRRFPFSLPSAAGKKSSVLLDA